SASCSVQVLAGWDDGIHAFTGEWVTWASPSVCHINVNHSWAGAVADATFKAAVFIDFSACFEDFLQDAFHFLFERIVVLVSHFNSSVLLRTTRCCCLQCNSDEHAIRTFRLKQQNS